MTPWTRARQARLSFTASRSLAKLMLVTGQLGPVKGDYGVVALISLSDQGKQCLSTDSFPGHVASMTKPLLAQQNTVTETRVHGNAIYLPTGVLSNC